MGIYNIDDLIIDEDPYIGLGSLFFVTTHFKTYRIADKESLLKWCRVTNDTLKCKSVILSV